MTGDAQDPWRTPTLLALGEQFERLEAGEAARAPEPRRGRQRRLLAATVAALVAVGAVLTIALTRHAPRALADVREAAAAAIRARTFAFDSKSVLSSSDGKSQIADERGVVDLARPGYRVQVDSGPGTVGFERIVFRRALYVRSIRTRGMRSWIGVHLRPEAQIAPTAEAGGGLADPLGLLGVLSKDNHAALVGKQRVGGVDTDHYRLRSSLGQFLRAGGQELGSSSPSAPVTIDVWLDGSNQVRLARRVFVLGGTPHARLEVSTSFDRYGAPVGLAAPAGVKLTGTQPPTLVAQDAVSASVSGALQLRSRHPSTPAVRRQR